MAEKPYSWASGAKLEDHSRRKHKILREYFANYLGVRCQLPQQTQFRLAIVDGFAGGGRYADAIAMNLWPSRGLAVHGFEIKISRGDWQREPPWDRSVQSAKNTTLPALSLNGTISPQ